MVGERVPIVSILGSSGKLEAVALREIDDCLADHIIDIVQKAQSNWLKNEEVLAVLEFFQGKQVEFPDQPAYQPDGGRLFMFSRKKCRGFRNDKHNWRKKNDKKTIKETHEKLKVQDQEKLNCYYAHAERDDGLQRRCYWILDKQFDDVVMVHYLCSSTSRIVGRTTPSKKSQQTVERASLRPRRAASMKTKFSDLFQEDSEELDRARVSPQRGDIGGTSTQIDESPDDLGDPLDSFIAKLPDDFGLNREFSRLDQLPGDLSLSANQIARIIEETTSPSKSPTKIDIDDKYLTLGGSNVSLGKMDLQGLLEGNSLHSPKKGLHGTLSDADSLLRGFSRLESLEFLKMVSPDVSLLNTQGYDGHLGSAGVAFVSKGNDSADLDKIARSDSYNDKQPSLKPIQGSNKESEKVSTIRRVVAPGTTGSSSGFESSFALQDTGSEKHRKMPNPINRNTQKTASVRMTEAALAANDHNIERRESLLTRVRESKDHTRKSDEDDGLIHPPTLFRSQSHLVEAGKIPGIPMHVQEVRDKSPEKTAVLLKQMSIDEASKPTAEFLRNLSIDLPPVDENSTVPLEGFGSELLPDKSKDS